MVRVVVYVSGDPRAGGLEQRRTRGGGRRGGGRVNWVSCSVASERGRTAPGSLPPSPGPARTRRNNRSRPTVHTAPRRTACDSGRASHCDRSRGRRYCRTLELESLASSGHTMDIPPIRDFTRALRLPDLSHVRASTTHLLACDRVSPASSGLTMDILPTGDLTRGPSPTRSFKCESLDHKPTSLGFTLLEPELRHPGASHYIRKRISKKAPSKENRRKVP